MARPPGNLVDRYELLEHLANGAQAEIHRARDLVSGQDVVLRFPHKRVLNDPALLARWRREVQLTARLRHPNVQQRLDLDHEHSEPYEVVAYAGGGSLDAWTGSDAAGLPIGQVLCWGGQLAQALAYVHRHGIIHRDVKPANILVTDDLELRLADFGAAIFRRNRLGWLRLPGPPEGTPEYLSPEQITGRIGDARSDIYQWGIVMYELLTGRVPYRAPDEMSVLVAHIHHDLAPIRDLRPDVPAKLEQVVLRALQRRPEHRYPDDAALLVALAEAAG